MGTVHDLFQGISVVIDDDIGEGTRIDQLISSIESENLQVLKLNELPKLESVANFNGASFIILDWEFNPLSEEERLAGLQLGAEAKKQLELDNIRFIKALESIQFIPIFVFTDAGIEHVKQMLVENGLYHGDGGDHIFIMNKEDVLHAGLFATLETWISDHPSAYVLKKWDQSYVNAKNSLFNDFYQNSRYWPIVIWDTHKSDGISAAVELGHLISRNIESRMSPVNFDSQILEERHKDKFESIESAEIKRVLEGERFIDHKFLDENSYTTGDIFRHKTKQRLYKINIRSECDCVPRNGTEAHSVLLYMLSGKAQTDVQLQKYVDYTFGLLRENDGFSFIFNAHNGHTLRFDFDELEVCTLAALSTDYERVGRLLSPYLSRLIQRYSAYSQRSGLPKIPHKALPQEMKSAAEAVKKNIA